VSTVVESRDVRNCRLFSRAASAAAVFVGSLALVGWLLSFPALTSILPGLATMKPNTALCFVLAGVSLWLIQVRAGEVSSPRVRRIQAARVLSGVVGFVGLLTLAEYLFHLNLGIDEIVFRRTLLATGVLHPGRMSGATALGFFCLGTGVLFVIRRWIYLAQSLAILASLNGFIACLGYLLGVRALYAVSAYSSTALHTAVLFVLMGMGVLAARPRLGVMAVVTSENMGGVMARRVLPLVIVVPILFGWLRWRGQAAELYGTEFGVALRTLGEVGTFATLVWISAVWLDRIDEKRRRAERRNFDLATMVASSDDAMLSIDLSSKIVSWNKAAEQLFGYAAAEIVGKPVTILIPAELQEEATHFLKEVGAGRLVTRNQTARRRKDGSLVYVSLTISPVRDFEGQIVGASAIAQDISERRRAEELRERLASVVESSDDAIVGKNLDGIITAWNSGAKKLFGYSSAEAVGKPILMLLPPERASEEADILARIRRGESVEHFETVRVRKDGKRIDVSATISPIKDGSGAIVGASKIARDITERKHAEAELTRSRQALEDQTLLLQSVLDSISDGLVAADEQGKFILWNPAAEKIVGLAAANVPPDQWSEHYGVYLPDKVTPFPVEDNPLARAIQGKVGAAVMYLRHQKLTEGVFIEITASPLRDKGGRLRGGVAAFRNITERLRAEDRLLEYERVVENLEDMILVIDRDYRYVIANRAFLSYRAMDREQVIGHRVDEVLQKEVFDSIVKEKMDECFAGKVIQFELNYTYPGRGERAVFTSYFPIEGPTGVDRIACVLQDITERKRSEEALRKSEERFSKAFRSSPVAITISTEAEGRYLDVNDAFLQMVERMRKDVIGRTTTELNFWAEPSQRVEMVRQLGVSGRVTGLRAQGKTSTGEIRELDLSAELIEIEGRCVLAITRDITETMRLEAQFRQAQKMEAVGRLAGGVAHDFNNMLGVILGYSDLSLSLIAPESKAVRHLEQIKKASHRAVGLTRQLLAFSRQQVVFPKNLDLNEVVQNVTTMLQRLVGEDVAMSFRPTVPIGVIHADPGQIEQILMNLVVNARDAMPGGGEIIIETGHAELDEHYVSQHTGSHAGQHVVLVVSDTGCGMDETIKSQIFEPFFTTKGIGQGTGLGLSTVYGIVKQGGGTIFVYSEPGKGTTFKLYFPRVAAKAEHLLQSREETEFPGGSETILVVEDDEPLRDLTVRMLKDAGYRVIEAGNADAAIGILKTSKPAIDLLLTDVIMPGKSGAQLLEQAKGVHPNLHSLFMSGYTGDLVALRGGLVPEAAFLEKPFTRSSLLKKVRSALQSGPAEGQAS
jgi:two-component system cell cycle sensor histidine kinase/response regulator CckA